MDNKLTRGLARKVRVGRSGVPVWVIGLAAMGVAAAAGQAVGPVLAGSISGSAGLTVAQTVLLDNGRTPTTAGTDDSAVVMNDERTEFTAAMVLKVGQLSALCIYLENNSGAGANALLELSVPAGVDVSVEEFSDDTVDDSTNDCDTGAMGADEDLVTEGQLSASKWALTVGGGATGDEAAGDGGDDGIQIKIEPKDDLMPGYYTIRGRIVQTAS